jgi:hypothetical protein
MNSKLYSSIFALLLAFSLASAALVTEPTNEVKTQFQDSSNQVLDKPVTGEFSVLTNKLFRNSGDLTLNKAIIFYVLLILVFSLVLNVSSLVPFFDSRVKGFLIALVVALLVALSGAYTIVTEYLFSLAHSFTSSWANVALLGIVVVLFFVISYLGTLLKNMYRSQNVIANEMIGMKLGSDAALAKKESKINREI